MNNKQRVGILLRRLPVMYPDARCLLEYQGDPGRLLISTILSARTTDNAVNQVAPGLWESVADMKGLADADPAVVEEIVHPLGFFRAKTRSIIRAARWVVEHGGIPDTIQELVRIPGVGRKTANVIVGEAFGRPAIIVDTHVGRLSGRLDLTRAKDPDKIEMNLRRLIPDEHQTAFSHQLGFHGRNVCTARKPSCSRCGLSDICPRKGI